MTKNTRHFVRFAALAAVLFFGAVSAWSYTVEEECDFAERIAGPPWRMADLALKALDALEAQHPTQKEAIAPARVTALSYAGKLSNAVELVKTLKAGEAADDARIALAKVYYRIGKVAEAKDIFADYFKSHAEPPRTPAGLKSFRAVCSQYGAMMKAAGENRAAAEAGRRYLKTIPATAPIELEEVADAIRCDMGVLLLEEAKKNPADKDALLKEIDALCNLVLKHGVNLFWGQALATKANGLLAKGDRAGALKLIQENIDILKPLDEFLEENKRLSESPMAGIRMMRGQILEDDAKAAIQKKDEKTAFDLYKKAINEYINVFVKYGGSDYGLPAGTKANAIKKILEAAPFNKKVEWKMTAEAEEQMLEQNFRLADQKMRSRDFTSAIAEYLKVLKEYPESDRSVRALGALLRCYAESDDKTMVKVTATYIGERFHKRAFAADLIRGLGKLYIDKKDEAMFNFVCDTYLDCFPKDPNSCSVLFTLATLHIATNDYTGAKPHLERLIASENCKDDAAYVKAVGQLASIEMTESNFTASAENYKTYAALLPAGIDRIQAESRMADALRLQGKPGDALPVYEKVVRELRDPNNQFSKGTRDVAAKAKDTLERSAFYVGICYNRMTEDVEANRQKATSAFQAFLKEFSDSTNYAPKAYAGIGQVYLQADKFDEASKVFQELAQKYPNTAEGKNALIALVQSALEIKRIDQAKKAFEQMTKSSAVSVNQYAQMGQLWLDNGAFAEAAQAYGNVVGKTQDRNLLQPALFGLGKAHFEAKKYAESAKALSDLLTNYPRTPYFFDAQLLLSASSRETGKFDDALSALGEIMNQPVSSPPQKMQAQYEIMKLQEKQGKKSEALASSLRVVGLAGLSNEKNAALLGWIEKMAVDGVRIGSELQRYADVIELCDQYMKLLPKGGNLEAIRRAKADAVGKAATAPAAEPAPAAGAK